MVRGCTSRNSYASCGAAGMRSSPALATPVSYIWSENWTLARQAAAPGGAPAPPGCGWWRRSAGCGREFSGVGVEGLDGDLVAEAFQALNVVADLAAGVHALFVVVSAQVLVVGSGVG